MISIYSLVGLLLLFIPPPFIMDALAQHGLIFYPLIPWSFAIVEKEDDVL